MFFFLLCFICCLKKKKRNSYTLGCQPSHVDVYLLHMDYIHTCMQGSGKHKSRVIYIIAENNCTIFLVCADGMFERDFYCEVALSFGVFKGKQRLTRVWNQHSAQLWPVRGKIWLWSNGLRPSITVPVMKKRNKSPVYANVWVPRANLWVQSETRSALFLVLVAESLAIPMMAATSTKQGKRTSLFVRLCLMKQSLSQSRW